MTPHLPEAHLHGHRMLGHTVNAQLSPQAEAWLRSAYSALDPAQWQSLYDLADASLILPAWHLGLHRLGLSASAPEPFRVALDAAWQLNRDRNQRLVQEVVHVSQLLAQIKCRPVALKGMAHILTGLYDDIGTRMTTDLDVLVPEAAAIGAARHLMTHDYHFGAFTTEAGTLPRHIDFHLRPLRKADHLAAVELHTGFLKINNDPVPARVIFEQAQPVPNCATLWVPDATTAIALAVAHSTLRPATGLGKRIHMRDLMDVVALMQRRTPDMARLIQLFERAGHGQSLDAFFYLTQSILGYDHTLPAARLSAQRGQDLAQRMTAGHAGWRHIAPFNWIISFTSNAAYRRHIRSIVTNADYRKAWMEIRKLRK